MRPDEDAGLAHQRIAAAAHRGNPLLDELRLADRLAEQRRGDIQDDRPGRVETDLLAELLTGSRWATIEPLVVALCAGDGDAGGRDAVQLHRLLLLRVVPDGDQIGNRPQDRLAG